MVTKRRVVVRLESSPPVERLSFAGRAQSFHYAFAGLVFMLRTQHNAWIHAAVTGAVILAGLVLNLRSSDWRWLVAAIAMVWLAEAIKTAFEQLCEVVSPQFHSGMQRCKDIASGAVLICAFSAALLGAATFWPYLFGH